MEFDTRTSKKTFFAPKDAAVRKCFPNEPWSFKMLASSFDTDSFHGVLAEDGGEIKRQVLKPEQGSVQRRNLGFGEIAGLQAHFAFVIAANVIVRVCRIYDNEELFAVDIICNKVERGEGFQRFVYGKGKENRNYRKNGRGGKKNYL